MDKNLKEQMMLMAVSDIELLFCIISDLSFEGYKISLCKLKGYSLQQCATKFGVSKSNAQYAWEKCQEKNYDVELKRLFMIG
jgi:hypothetical protein